MTPHPADAPSYAPEDWYKPGRSIQQFHDSGARIRALIGARGSGKTWGVAMEVVRHGWHTPGGKVYILRKTEKSQDNSTLDTFRNLFMRMGDLYKQVGDVSLFKVYNNGSAFRIPSADAVERWNQFLATGPGKMEIMTWLKGDGDRYCSHVHFAGVPDASKRATRFRGMECSMLVFVEADELDEADWVLAQACVRWKDAYGKDIKTGGSILDSNPPGKSHWIAKMEKAAETVKDNRIQFWHIPTEQNAHNLPPGYVDDLKFTYRNNPAGYSKMVLGEYADSYDGTPVYFAFSAEKHVFDNLPWPAGAYLIRSFDFGTSNAVVWSAYFRRIFKPKKPEDQMIVAEYWWDLHELYEENSDTERQCRRVIEITAQKFPFWNDRSICAGVIEWCDPAGNAKKSTGQDVEILRSHGFRPGFKYKNRGLQVTFAIVNRLLEAQDPDGNYCYRIDRTHCERLYAGLQGAYRYPSVGEPGYGLDAPLKGAAGGNFDHICDAQRYGVINSLNLANVGNEVAAPRAGALAHPTTVNRPKVYY